MPSTIGTAIGTTGSKGSVCEVESGGEVMSEVPLSVPVAGAEGSVRVPDDDGAATIVGVTEDVLEV